MKKRILSLFLAVLTLATIFILPAQAATYSWKRGTETIWVETKANYWVPGSSSITIKQDKGTMSYSKTNFWGKVTGTATKKLYGTWNIHVESTDGKDKYNKTLSGSSIKLNLKANKNYRITISYDYIADTFMGLKYRNAKWTTEPSWRVSGTWKVADYS